VVEIFCGAISSTLRLSDQAARLIDGLGGEGLPAIDLAHVDLAGSEQSPEQHRGGVRRWQHGLGLDPSLELFMQPQPREGKEPFARFLQAVGDGDA
jgi:hypothetical protein